MGTIYLLGINSAAEWTANSYVDKHGQTKTFVKETGYLRVEDQFPL
jgi:hypothetical protein